MIYTLTLNPSIDYYVYVDSLILGGLQRVTKEFKYPGGKGINVSRVLVRMGSRTKALGFIGGFTGQYIQDVLDQEKIVTDFTLVDGDSRINIKMKTECETEINGLGPKITGAEQQHLFAKIDALEPEAIFVIAGSIPPSLNANLYAKILEKCQEKKAKVVVDISGKTMLDLLKYKPFLVKPNMHELAEFFQVEINDLDDVVHYARKLVDMGAELCIVSMGEEGAVLITTTEAYVANVPQGKLVNSAGAGDSLVAGFIGTFEKTHDIQQAFAYGIATGSATAFSLDLCTKKQIEQLLPQIKLTKIKECTP